MSISLDNVVCFTDSQIVIALLNKSPNTLQVFVRNRVSKITISLIIISGFMYLEATIADLATRGISAKSFQENKFWLEEPNCNRHSLVNLKRKVDFYVLDYFILTLSLAKSHDLSEQVEDRINYIDFISSYNHLLNVVARILRICLRPHRNRAISVKERNRSLFCILRYIQSCGTLM